MFKKYVSLTILYSIAFVTCVNAYTDPEMDSIEMAQLMNYYAEANELQESIEFKDGIIDLSERIELTVPEGYRYINKKDAEKILFDFWGNPESDFVLGMLVLDSFHVANYEDWAFVLSEELDGYVEDEDAEDIDYDDMLTEMKEEEEEINAERAAAGYGPIHTIGWASKPYYDSEAKILHWAKELNFDGAEENTLNYDVRILGRHGLLSMNAVGTISALEDVKKHVPEIIHIAKFKEGSTYSDFNPDIDKVAAYTVGGLVAGKILAKAGILALILKNIKFVIIALIGVFSVFKNKILALFTSSKATTTEELDS